MSTLFATYLSPDNIFTVAGLLTVDECEALIARGEGMGFEPASVTTPTGQQMMANVRNNDRVDLCDPILNQDIWQRVQGVLPTELGGLRAIGLHPRLRFYRYDPGQRFKRHQDGRVRTDAGDVSRLTLMIYLNQGFGGGETIFREYATDGGERKSQEIVVRPATGMGLCFVHERWHEGAEITFGRKYVLRADVLYSPNRAG